MCTAVRATLPLFPSWAWTAPRPLRLCSSCSEAKSRSNPQILPFEGAIPRHLTRFIMIRYYQACEVVSHIILITKLLCVAPLPCYLLFGRRARLLLLQGACASSVERCTPPLLHRAARSLGVASFFFTHSPRLRSSHPFAVAPSSSLEEGRPRPSITHACPPVASRHPRTTRHRRQRQTSEGRKGAFPSSSNASRKIPTMAGRAMTGGWGGGGACLICVWCVRSFVRARARLCERCCCSFPLADAPLFPLCARSWGVGSLEGDDE